jgi:hypothetical protein
MDFSLFRQIFHVATLTSTDARGDEVHATPAAWLCRYEPSSRLFKDVNGFQQVASGVIYTLAPVTQGDLIWPPGADKNNTNESFRPLRIDKHYDLDSGQIEFYAVSF